MLYNMWWGGWPWMGGIWMLLWIAFWIFIIWLIVKLVQQGNIGKKEDPLEVAKTKYAKGKITKKELEEIRKELKK